MILMISLLDTVTEDSCVSQRSALLRREVRELTPFYRNLRYISICVMKLYQLACSGPMRQRWGEDRPTVSLMASPSDQ
jgi:hypothetical protein